MKFTGQANHSNFLAILLRNSLGHCIGVGDEIDDATVAIRVHEDLT